MRLPRRLLVIVLWVALLMPGVAVPLARGGMLLPTLPQLPTLLPPQSIPLLPSIGPIPSLPLPSLPLPSGPLPTLPPLPTTSPLPSVPLPTLPPLPSNAPTPSIRPVLPTSTAEPTPRPSPGGASPSEEPGAPTASGVPSQALDQSGGGAGPDAPGDGPGTTPVDPSADETPPGALDGFVLPGLTIGVPLLLALLFLVVQAVGGAALLPAVRRTLGSLGFRAESMPAPLPEEPEARP